MKTVTSSPHIADYIHSFDTAQQKRLNLIYDTIKSILLDSEETMAYGIPTFKVKKNVIHFAGYQHHIGLYPGAMAVNHFKQELIEYKTSKGTIQISHQQEIPVELIRDITQFCLANVKR